MEIDDARILVFTVDCWSNRVGANTMCSLFSWCNSEHLANLYIRPEIPTFRGCGNYFQITEYSIIRSIVRSDIQTGKRVSFCDEEDPKVVLADRKRYRMFRAFRPWSGLMMREILWSLGHWKTKELNDFIDAFKPDLIVAPYEGYIHLNRIIRYTVNRTGAKFIGYFWDDNFTFKQMRWSLGYILYRMFQRRDIKKTVELSSINFAICPKTKKEADIEFSTNCELLTKPIDMVGREFEQYNCQSPIKILYTGNLGIGRLATIKILGKALDGVNAIADHLELHIYTKTYVSKKERLKLGKSVVLHDAVSQTEVLQIQKTADILLFVEALKGRYSKVARLSFSTKLTDYFAAGKCILAIARRDIAPTEYLIEHDAAIIASCEQEISDRLLDILNNRLIISKYAKNAWNCGKNYHNSISCISLLRYQLGSLLID